MPPFMPDAEYLTTKGKAHYWAVSRWSPTLCRWRWVVYCTPTDAKDATDGEDIGSDDTLLDAAHRAEMHAKGPPIG